MIPIILIAHDESRARSYVEGYAKEHGVDRAHIIELSPAAKEYSINQIKEIRREIAYSASQNTLYVLYDFGHASYEAQNAFLKVLEEHPAELGFILVTANVHALLPTITSRSNIVSLEKDTDAVVSPKVTQSVDAFLKAPSLAALEQSAFDVKKYDEPLALFDELIMYFRGKLDSLPQAPHTLTEIITARSLVANNNIAPQHGIDHIFLQLKKLLSQP